MIKHLIILFCLILFSNDIILLQGQDTAKVEIPLYFEDVFGNKDTLIIGYDPDISWNKYAIKPQFGEVPITEPFDSTFEVRLYSLLLQGQLKMILR